MKTGPYVGISGVTRREQVDAILAMAPAGMLVALGILASQKTIAGGDCNARSPAAGDIQSIWPAQDGVLRMLHYFTKDTRDLADQLARAMDAAGARCDGIQLNIPWPPVAALESFRARFPFARVVLQLGPAVLELASLKVERDAKVIADRLVDYVPSINDILLDVSGGTGTAIDVASASHVLSALVDLRTKHRGLGLGIAGGIGSPLSIELVGPLLRAFGPLSIDAESRLRTAKDDLDLERVRSYLTASAVTR